MILIQDKKRFQKHNNLNINNLESIILLDLTGLENL